MKKMLLLCGALLVVSASVASAAGTLLLGADGCRSDGALGIQSFACLSNAAGTPTTLACSFTPAQNIPFFQGILGYLAVQTAGATPAWWGNACTGKLTPFTVNAPNGVCSANGVVGDPYVNPPSVFMNGGGTGLTYPYGGNANVMEIEFYVSNTASFEIALAGGTEYELASVAISHTKSVLAGTAQPCAGCLTPAALNFFQADIGSIDKAYADPTHVAVNETLQGGVASIVGWQAPGVVPARTSTWGSVKALYR